MAIMANTVRRLAPKLDAHSDCEITSPIGQTLVIGRLRSISCMRERIVFNTVRGSPSVRKNSVRAAFGFCTSATYIYGRGSSPRVLYVELCTMPITLV